MEPHIPGGPSQGRGVASSSQRKDPLSVLRWVPAPLRPHLGRVWIVAALAAVVSAGVLIVLVLRMETLGDSVGAAEFGQVVAEVNRSAGAAVFAVQDERGRAELWLGTGDAGHRAEYEATIAASDRAVADLRRAWEAQRAVLVGMGPPSYQDALGALATLPPLRNSVLAREEGSAFAGYSGVLDVLIGADAAAAAMVAGPPLVAPIQANVHLVRAGEAWATQRGLIGVRIVSGATIGSEEAVRLTLAEQEAGLNLAAARALLDTDTAGAVLDLVGTSNALRVQEMLDDAASGNAGALDADEWFTAATVRLDGLRRITREVGDEVLASARTEEEAARRARFRWFAGLSSLFVLTLIAGMGAIVISRERLRALDEYQELSDGLIRWFHPSTFSEVPAIEVAARYEPASRHTLAGGDWYDVYPVGAGDCAITIGDVVGHGPQATARMAQLRNLLRGMVVAGSPSPAHQVALLDGAMAESGMAATVFHGLIDLASGRMRYVRAGHLPALLLRPDGSMETLAGGLRPPVGAVGAVAAQDATVQLEPGSVVVLVTDGVVEVRGRDLDEGFAAVAALLSAASRSLDDMVGDLISARPRRMSHDDDAAVLLVRWTGDRRV